MPQYLSTDPNAGRSDSSRYLSTDPNAGSSTPSHERERSWTDTAVDALPTVGGFVGSLAGGGKWNPLGMAGAAVGGAGGEFVRQIVNAVRGSDDTPTSLGDQLTRAGEQGLLQAGLEGGGRAVLGGAGRVIKGVTKFAPAARTALTSSPAKEIAADLVLDAVPLGNTGRRLARAGMRAMRSTPTEAAETVAPTIAKDVLPEGFERYLPNVSAGRTAEAAPAARPSLIPKTRTLSEGEERGIADLDALMDRMYGADFDARTLGNGLYREPAAKAASIPARSIRGADQDLLHALADSENMAAHSPTRTSVIKHPEAFDQGVELSRLLNSLSRGGR